LDNSNYTPTIGGLTLAHTGTPTFGNCDLTNTNCITTIAESDYFDATNTIYTYPDTTHCDNSYDSCGTLIFSYNPNGINGHGYQIIESHDTGLSYDILYGNSNTFCINSGGLVCSQGSFVNTDWVNIIVIAEGNAGFNSGNITMYLHTASGYNETVTSTLRNSGGGAVTRFFGGYTAQQGKYDEVILEKTIWSATTTAAYQSNYWDGNILPSLTYHLNYPTNNLNTPDFSNWVLAWTANNATSGIFTIVYGRATSTMTYSDPLQFSPYVTADPVPIQKNQDLWFAPLNTTNYFRHYYYQ